MPDLPDIPLWPGPDGGVAVPKTGSAVRVGFVNGEYTQPIVIGLDPTQVDKVYLRADVVVELGGGAVDFVAIAAKVQSNLDAINDALVSTGLPVIGGGGGTAKLALPVVFTSNASPIVKAST